MAKHYLQSIETVYCGPTDTKGARIRAQTSGGMRAYYPFRGADRIEDEHLKAARSLAKQLDWKWRMVGGMTRRGMVWVFHV